MCLIATQLFLVKFCVKSDHNAIKNTNLCVCVSVCACMFVISTWTTYYLSPAWILSITQLLTMLFRWLRVFEMVVLWCERIGFAKVALFKLLDNQLRASLCFNGFVYFCKRKKCSCVKCHFSVFNQLSMMHSLYTLSQNDEKWNEK